MKRHLHQFKDRSGRQFRIMYDAAHYTIFNEEDLLVASQAFDHPASLEPGDALKIAIAHARRLEREVDRPVDVLPDA